MAPGMIWSLGGSVGVNDEPPPPADPTVQSHGCLTTCITWLVSVRFTPGIEETLSIKKESSLSLAGNATSMMISKLPVITLTEHTSGICARRCATLLSSPSSA